MNNDYNLTMKGGAPITVKSNYISGQPWQNIQIEPNSHYNIDYILRHYEFLVMNEIFENLDNLNLGHFQKLVNLLSDLRRNINKSRNSILPVEQNDYASSDANRIYSVGMAANTRELGPVRTKINEIKNFIRNIHTHRAVLNSLQFPTNVFPNAVDINGNAHPIWDQWADWGFWDTTGNIQTTDGSLNFYFMPFSNLPTKIVKDLDDIDKEWQAYLLEKSSIPTVSYEDSFEKLRRELSDSTAKINDVVQSKDYAETYETIGYLLKQLPSLLDNVIDASFTESNIKIMMPDTSNIYDNIEFKSDDIVIEKPTDPVDVVSYDEIRGSFDKYKLKGLNISVNDIRKSLRVPGIRQPSIMTNKTELLSNMQKTLDNINTIDPDVNILNLLYAKIYKENDEIKVEYKDKNQRDAMDQQNQQRQRIFLDALTNENDTRLRRYINVPEYDDRAILTGGTKNQQYQIKEAVPQIASISQTGGQVIDISTHDEKRTDDIEKINEAEKILKDTNKSLDDQNTLFFDNKNVFSLERIEQYNLYLVEMMNFYIIAKFLTTNKNDEHQAFMKELREKNKEFHKILTNAWNILNSRVVFDSSQESTLKDLLSQGKTSMHQFVSFFKESGLAVNPTDYPDGFLLNSLPILATVNTLQDKFGSNIGEIMFNLKNLFTIGSTPEQIEESNEVLFSKMNSYYEEVKDLTRTMETARNAVIDEADDMDKIKSSIGEVVNKNLFTATTFINYILASIKYYNRNIQVYSTIDDKEKNIKHRLKEIKVYLNQSNQLITNYYAYSIKPNLLTDSKFTQIDKKLTSSSKPIVLANMYTNYKEYVEGTLAIQKNIIPYITSNKSVLDINNKVKVLSDAANELTIISSLIYGKMDKCPILPSVDNGLDIVNDTKSRILILNNECLLDANDIEDHSDLIQKFDIDNPQTTYDKMHTIIWDSILKLMDSPILLFKEIYYKINIPDIIDYFITEFAVIQNRPVTVCANMLAGNAKNKMSDQIKRYGLSTILKTIDTLDELLNRRNNIISKYCSNVTDKTESKNYTNEKTNRYKKIINDHKHLDDTPVYDDLYDYLDHLKTPLSFTPYLPTTNVKNFIINYLKKHVANQQQQQPTYNETDLGKFLNNKLRVFATSLLELYHTWLADYYNLLIAYGPDTGIVLTQMENQRKIIAGNRTNITELKLRPIIAKQSGTIFPIKTTHDDFTTNLHNIPGPIVTINDLKDPFGIFKNETNFIIDLMLNKINKKPILAKSKIDGFRIRILDGNIEHTHRTQISNGAFVNQDDTVFDGNNKYQINDPSGGPSGEVTFSKFDKKLSIAINTPITKSNLQYLKSIINTVSVLINILPKLFITRDDLNTNYRFVPGSQNERDKNKEILTNATNTINSINSVLIENRDNLIELHKYLKVGVTPFTTLILSAKIALQNTTTTNTTQFDIAMNNVYSFIISYVLLYLGLSATLFDKLTDEQIYKTINEVIKNASDTITVTDSGLLETKDYQEPHQKTVQFTKDVNTELGNRIDKDVISRQTQKPDFTKLKPNDIYKYYFTNSKYKELRLSYSLMAATTDESTKDKINEFNKLHDNLEEMFVFTRFFNQVEDESIMNFTDKSNQVQINFPNDRINQITEFINSISTRLKENLILNTMGSAIFNDYATNVQKKVIDDLVAVINTPPSVLASPYTPNLIDLTQTHAVIDFNGYNQIRLDPDLRIRIANLATNNDINALMTSLLYYFDVLFGWVDTKIKSYVVKIKNSFHIIGIERIERLIWFRITDRINQINTLKIINNPNTIGGGKNPYRDLDGTNTTNTIDYIIEQNKNNLKEELKIAEKFIDDFCGQIKPTLSANLEAEYNFFEKIFKLKNTVHDQIQTQNKLIVNRSASLKSMINIIDKEMFVDFFKNTAFVTPTDLQNRFSEVIDYYNMTRETIASKISGILRINLEFDIRTNQINSYNLFTSNLGKSVKGDTLYKERKYYKQMSFGLVEYYYDIIDNILKCLSKRSYEKMHPLEQYLYQNHFIHLNRIFSLFDWIVHTYLVEQEKTDKKILKKKINIDKAAGDIKNIFVEFNGIKETLDEYQATVMPSVSLHMRINDFRPRNDDRSGPPSEWDYDVDEPGYEQYEDKQVFNNRGKDAGRLIVDFDNIPLSGGNTMQELKSRYPLIVNKMKENPPGIPFTRIYNTKRFPDSDVISNYMSLTASLKNRRGVMISTYGYSGVGKSATLFGVAADPSTGSVAKSGILQTTIDGINTGKDGAKVFLRIYEIYGLGTQFDFYWNPRNDDTSKTNNECYPDFYQMVVHHRLGRDANGKLVNEGQAPIYNRADILSYIMDLKNPGWTTPNATTHGWTLNNAVIQPNVDYAPEVRSIDNNRHPEFRKMLSGPITVGGDDVRVFQKSTYEEINKNDYRDFSKFVDDQIEKVRGESKDGPGGFLFTNIYEHRLQQVKRTINNPKSSRSILVYDFQIIYNANDPATKMAVPFLIYDLPGKEDLFKTYVDRPLPGETPTPDQLKGLFSNIPNDLPIQIPGKPNPDICRERKSTYVLNPLLIPYFDDNYDAVDRVLKEIDGVIPVTNRAISQTFKQQLINDILDTTVQLKQIVPVNPLTTRPFSIQVKYFYKPDDPNNPLNPHPFTPGTPNPPPPPFQPSTWTWTRLTSFTNLLNPANIMDTVIAEPPYSIPPLGTTSQFQFAFDFGIAQTMVTPNWQRFVIKQIMIIIMKTLVKFGLFDVIVKMIFEVTQNHDADNGGWTIEKIYEFFEAYYINENVVGLLQYMINQLPGQEGSHPFDVQKSQSATEITSKNYDISAINQYFVSYPTPTDIFNGSLDLKLDPDLLVAPDGPDKVKKQADINRFATDYGVDLTNGTYIRPGRTHQQIRDTGRMIIMRQNQGSYNSNKIFRDGSKSCSTVNAPGTETIVNPFDRLRAPPFPPAKRETNRPLLEDFLEPYHQKIGYRYIFYVISNTLKKIKAEEQVKLLDNSMKFIELLNSSGGGNEQSCVQI
jgi:hypothetical protein